MIALALLIACSGDREQPKPAPQPTDTETSSPTSEPSCDPDDADCDGHTVAGGDCDDSDPAIHPGAPDPFYDGVDADCAGNDDFDADGDGYASAAHGGDDCVDLDPLVSPATPDPFDGQDTNCDEEEWVTFDEATARLDGDNPDDLFGQSLVGADLDGDGLGDLLVGAYGDKSVAWLSGAAYVYTGPLSGALPVASASAVILGDEAYDRAGEAVTAGDFDHDGVSDLVVGAPGQEALFLFRGPVSGTLGLSQADAVLAGWLAYAYVPHSLGVGDATGDGVADLLVGSDGGGDGRVDLVSGPLGSVDLALPDDALATIVNASGLWTGGRVALADVDGDGLDDLLLGDSLDHDLIGDSTGGVRLLLSPRVGAVEASVDHDGFWYGEHEWDEAGHSLARAGDVDGDGREDVLVGAPSADGGYGRVYLLMGPSARTLELSEADLVFVSQPDFGQAGWTVAGQLALDDEPTPDILVGASNSAIVFYGDTLSPGQHDLLDASALFVPDGEFAADVAGLPDMDGDGDDEAVVIHPYPGTGSVFVFAGWGG